jgi:phytoene dehydrogenase-like protein
MKPIVIVGAGLAGLTCAEYLRRANKPVLVIDKDDHVGGRVWSDSIDGFVLDRGFQVFLDSYPEAKACLDYGSLRLHKFSPGALVLTQKGFRRVADAIRDPLHVIDTIRSGAFTPVDMWRVLRLRGDARSLEQHGDTLVRSQTTLEFLVARNFSERAIWHFFKPFFSGVFLENELDTPADMFAFVFRMFSIGSACLPDQGMRAIPLQLAGRLPDESIRLNSVVSRVDRNKVTLADGHTLEAESVVLATDYTTTARLLDLDATDQPWRSTMTFYYGASAPPTKEPILVLNGMGQGIINNVVVPTNVCSSYSSTSDALVSVSLVGNRTDDEEELRHQIHNELKVWFGESVSSWRFLTSYRIPYSLPVRFGTKVRQEFEEVAGNLGVQLAGDYLVNPSINGAMASGREAAEKLLANGGGIA